MSAFDLFITGCMVFIIAINAVICWMFLARPFWDFDRAYGAIFLIPLTVSSWFLATRLITGVWPQ